MGYTGFQNHPPMFINSTFPQDDSSLSNKSRKGDMKERNAGKNIPIFAFLPNPREDVWR